MIHPRSLLFAFVVAVALAGFPGVGHTAGDIRVNGDLPGTVQNEIRITRNATDLLNLALVYNDGIGLPASPLGVSFTLDGGATWSDRQLSVPRHPVMGTPDDNLALTAIFDPYIDSDPSGNLYAGYIATAAAYLFVVLVMTAVTALGLYQACGFGSPSWACSSPSWACSSPS